MLPAETIKEIAGMALARAPLEAIDPYTKGVRQSDGKLELVEIDAKPRTTIAYRIDDLVANIARNKTEAAEVHYSRLGIRGFYDSSRRESVTMQLTKSKPFERLAEWDSQPKQIPQASLFLLLKTVFKGCCDDVLQNIIRTIKWTMGNNGESTVRQGSVSMNKSIIAEMSGADDLNKIEYVTFEVPVFLEMPALRARIECHIRPIPDQQMFSIIPTGGHIEAAYRHAEDTMRVMIESAAGKDSGIAIYHGTAEADCAAAAKLA